MSTEHTSSFPYCFWDETTEAATATNHYVKLNCSSCSAGKGIRIQKSARILDICLKTGLWFGLRYLCFCGATISQLAERVAHVQRLTQGSSPACGTLLHLIPFPVIPQAVLSNKAILSHMQLLYVCYCSYIMYANVSSEITPH